jgi:hypothetical protein
VPTVVFNRFPSFRSVLNRPPVKHFPHKRPPLGPNIVAVFEGDLDSNNLENYFGRPKPLRTARQRPDRCAAHSLKIRSLCKPTGRMRSNSRVLKAEHLMICIVGSARIRARVDLCKRVEPIQFFLKDNQARLRGTSRAPNQPCLVISVTLATGRGPSRAAAASECAGPSPLRRKRRAPGLRL